MKAVVVNPESTGVVVVEKELRPLKLVRLWSKLSTVVFVTLTSTLPMVILVRFLVAFLVTKESVLLQKSHLVLPV